MVWNPESILVCNPIEIQKGGTRNLKGWNLESRGWDPESTEDLRGFSYVGQHFVRAHSE